MCKKVLGLIFVTTSCTYQTYRLEWFCKEISLPLSNQRVLMKKFHLLTSSYHFSFKFICAKSRGSILWNVQKFDIEHKLMHSKHISSCKSCKGTIFELWQFAKLETPLMQWTFCYLLSNKAHYVSSKVHYMMIY